MSASADCPLCGYCSRNIVVPDERWGDTLNQVELERCFDDDKDMIHTNILELGRTTFWCPCGRMVWMERIGWLVSLNFIARLAAAIRPSEPWNNQTSTWDGLIHLLSQLMPPDEVRRITQAMEERE